jgi:hypothetical protein
MRWYGIFLAAATVGGVDERLAVPFLKVSGWRVRAVSEVGEAIFCGDAASVAPEKSAGGFSQETEVFVLGVSADNRSLTEADCLGCGAAGQMGFAIVQAVIFQPSAQFDP